MEFIQKYFIEPTLTQSGYNIVNTSVYSTAFICLLFVAIKFFKKSKIRLDEKVWFDLLPFVFLGGILRTLFDLNFFDPLGPFKYFFITPLIYLSVFLVILACTLLSRIYTRFIKYSGLALAGIFGLVALTFGKNLYSLLTVLFLSSLVYTLTLIALRILKLSRVAKGINSHVIFGHILDASSAAVAVFSGYREAQILSSTLLASSPFTFILIKVLLPVLLLYYIDRKSKGNTNFILKFALLVLGLPQGVHNSLLLFTK